MNTVRKSKSRTDAAGSSEKIAVVGIGCRYPGAESPRQLWENILSARREFRRMPDVRLPIADYHDGDRTTPDKTYGLRAAVIDGYEFDWAGRRIPKTTYDATDLAHWLALDTALQMLSDAGYDASRLPGETTQVIVGNTLTGEFTRSNTLRLRWPYVRRALRASAENCGMPASALQALEEDMELVFKSAFAPVNEDTLAGGLANTIAGRITNYLNLNGGGYVVDGACCSSLIAVYSGAVALAAGEADFVIAGGVDISLDPFELVGFAKTGALSPTQMRVYDSRGNGFIPGEGCGFVGLKRLADAQRDGDKIYAVLDGWGMSSDGRGGITAPSISGQAIALARAYQSVDLDASPLDFIEGHGTGTSLGDKVELSAISRTVTAEGDSAVRTCGVTSFKSIVGHTKAAAGIGAFIKGVMAVNQRVLPPTAGCEQPHDVFQGDGRAIYPLLRGEKRAPDGAMRAGVSAMGFGGINVHVTVTAPPAAPQSHLAPTIDERAVMSSSQDSELFVFAAIDAAELGAQVRRVRAEAVDISLAELADLSASLCERIEAGQAWRASVVASSHDDLLSSLDQLIQRISQGGLRQGDIVVDREHRYTLSNSARSADLGFVFPGQGSQQLCMARSLIERFDWARSLAQQADAWAAEVGTPGLLDAIYPNLNLYPFKAERTVLAETLMQTQLAQPAIVLASLLWLERLRRLGVEPAAVLGHSLGELTAFHAAGAYDAKALIQLATVRGRCMAESAERIGAMASLACALERANTLVAAASSHGYLVVANVNSPEQVVVSGDTSAIDAVVSQAQQQGINARLLPVSNAFHSELMNPAAERLLAQAPVPASPQALRATVYSACLAGTVDDSVALPRYFADQMLKPVQFVAATRALTGRHKLLVEVGPGRVLSNLISRIDGGDTLCLPLEGEAERHADFHWALACLHAYGVAVRWTQLHANRLVRPFVPAAQKQFIVNPCERPLAEPVPRLEPVFAAASPVAVASSGGDSIDSAIDQLQRYLSDRGRFIAEVMKADIRHSGTGTAPVPAASAAVSASGSIVERLLAATPAAPAASVTKSAPSTPAVAAVATPAAATGGATRSVLVRLAAELTGFDAQRIALSMRPVDDLNLDSIKAGSLVGRAAVELGIAGQLDASELASLTLEEIAARMDALVGPQSIAVTAPVTHASTASAMPILLDAVAQMTGFATNRLTPNLRLIDDLNMDSIKVGALLAEVASQCGLAGQVDASELAGSTLGEIAARMDALAGPARPAPAASTSASAPAAMTVLRDAVAQMTGFAADRLTPELRLIDDLNMDSIKVGALLADVATRCGLAGKVDSAELAGATLGEIATRLDALATPATPKSSAPVVAAAPRSTRRACHPGCVVSS
ncbi:type I polyketide synthase [Tahibacter amnicola]|uniref:Type I polyketide synthase n=1 Tax=Tahibacter amnicola TaxID=2976241 RepID=A0ABY6BHH4_9GAMM|nr:type I polyketide synthase [Tahibacter amnicola]UXI69473.1 type I polyketide synthase [Tahibacter amnicola]